MEAVLEIPKRKTVEVVLTGQMRRAASRILAIHGGGGLVVVHGRSRLGKTTTANWITGGINDQYNPDDPASFRALHYEVGEIPPWSGQEMKKGIRSLYHATIGRLDEGQYRQLPPEDLARQLVFGLRRHHLQMIFVDEAGCLSVDAIRGMVLVSDVAHLSNWPLTIVFVGMDDLPTKICDLPQLEKRVHEWLYFFGAVRNRGAGG
jgi:AAA domain